MKVRLRLRTKAAKKKNSHAVGKTILCTLPIFILSLLNVRSLDHSTLGWSRSLQSLFNVHETCPHNMTVDILSVSSTSGMCDTTLMSRSFSTLFLFEKDWIYPQIRLFDCSTEHICVALHRSKLLHRHREGWRWSRVWKQNNQWYGCVNQQLL